MIFLRNLLCIVLSAFALIQDCWAMNATSPKKVNNDNLYAIVEFVHESSRVVLPLTNDQKSEVESFFVEYFSRTQARRDMFVFFRNGYEDACGKQSNLESNLKICLFGNFEDSNYYYLLGVDFALFLGASLDLKKIELAITAPNETKDERPLVRLVSSGVLDHIRMNSQRIVSLQSNKGDSSKPPSTYVYPIASFPFLTSNNINSYSNVKCIVHTRTNKVQVIDEKPIGRITKDLRELYINAANQHFPWNMDMETLQIMLIDGGYGAYILFY